MSKVFGSGLIVIGGELKWEHDCPVDELCPQRPISASAIGAEASFPETARPALAFGQLLIFMERHYEDPFSHGRLSV
jgi:hypothetical protein